ncbi:zf-HC2 domain-containing protein, partial [Mycobacterium tuberculosis]
MPTHSNAQRRQVIGECCRRGARRIPRRPTGGTTGRDSARVDEHLGECSACRAWFTQVASQAGDLRRLAES